MNKMMTVLGVGGAATTLVYFFKRSWWKPVAIVTLGVAAFVWWKSK